MRARNVVLVGVGAVLLLCVAVIVGLGLLGRALDGDGDGDGAGVRPTRRAASTATAAAVRPLTGPAPTLSAASPAAGTGDRVTRQPMDAVAVVRRVRPAVVTVVAEVAFGEGFEGDGTSVGTGFIIDDFGYIVTNAHVVEDSRRIEVILVDGEERGAELVGADPISDLAVVRAGGEMPATVTLGDSEALKPGQPVLAIGSPLGSFTNTVTRGIVSALERDVPTAPDRPQLSNLIQHDAAINPGNSGGPLVNAAGEVVGVNTLEIQQTEAGVPAQGLGFAIPAETVREIAAELIEEGAVDYPFFGVGTIAITEGLASQNDLPVDYGVYVEEVTPGGPAAEAGIREGDIILALDGRRIDAGASFAEVLFAYEPGDSVRATVRRGANTFDVEVVLATRPDE